VDFCEKRGEISDFDLSAYGRRLSSREPKGGGERRKKMEGLMKRSEKKGKTFHGEKHDE